MGGGNSCSVLLRIRQSFIVSDCIFNVKIPPKTLISYFILTFNLLGHLKVKTLE